MLLVFIHCSPEGKIVKGLFDGKQLQPHNLCLPFAVDTDNTWLGKTPSRRMPGPVTSTAIKRARPDEMSSDGAGSEYDG